MARTTVVLLLMLLCVGLLGLSASADSLVHPLLAAAAVAVVLVVAARGWDAADRHGLSSAARPRPIGALRTGRSPRGRADTRAALAAASLLLRRG
jgi:hypothetical protein